MQEERFHIYSEIISEILFLLIMYLFIQISHILRIKLDFLKEWRVVGLNSIVYVIFFLHSIL